MLNLRTKNSVGAALVDDLPLKLLPLGSSELLAISISVANGHVLLIRNLFIGFRSQVVCVLHVQQTMQETTNGNKSWEWHEHKSWPKINDV